jgi:DNA-3-methyladenine glycosylase I
MSGTPVSLNRCAWCGRDPLYTAYHDDEWGVPVFDERWLFEMLILEGAQAGLAWITILRKREGYRRAVDGFDPEQIARYDEARIQTLLADPGIVRNRLKVQAAVGNARALLDFRDGGESFADLLWSHVDGVPRLNAWRTLEDVPATTPESDAMSRNLKRLGFKFVGGTVC